MNTLGGLKLSADQKKKTRTTNSNQMTENNKHSLRLKSRQSLPMSAA